MSCSPLNQKLEPMDITTEHSISRSAVSTPLSLLHLLQLTSSALPVGAYSYSEGLESLVHMGELPDAEALKRWLQGELAWGSIRMDAAIAHRIYQAASCDDIDRVVYWNQWLSATRETEELREQNWQMGRALVRLLTHLDPESMSPEIHQLLSLNRGAINFATAFAIAAVYRHICDEDMLLGYLHSWASNLVNAGIKLIPLGQTAGQQLLGEIYPDIEQTLRNLMTGSDDDLSSCTWGLAIASMTHESLYSRLFRS